MSGAIGSSGISFSSIVTAYNNVKTTDLSTTNISLSGFRGKTFSDGTSVPSSGAISINSHFKSKTWQADNVSAPTLSEDYKSYWSYSGSGTQASPYDGWSSNNGRNNTTAYMRWKVNGNGFVWVWSYVSSESNYDFGHIFVNGSQKWRTSGYNRTFNWTKYAVSDGQKVEFRYTKDYSVHTHTDKQRMKIYTSAT